MRVVCAWCGTVLSPGKPGDTQVSHGICGECVRRYFPTGFRYAVVPRDRSFMLAEIERAFRLVSGIRVILDRRRSERRRRHTQVRSDRRALRRDRRQTPCPVVGAVPVVAGLWLPGARLVAPGRPGESSPPEERHSLHRHPSRPSRLSEER